MLMRSEIFLIRHGRSAHVHTGWIDVHGFHRWREAYEAAGILPTEAPPHEVRELAQRAGVLVSSDAPRAIGSALLLAQGREVITSPLLRELDLPPPSLRALRLPLAGWALAFGIRSLYRGLTSRQHIHASAAEIARAREAADWLTGLARQQGAVAVVTHATFRALLASTLMADGWKSVGSRPRSRHWSAWTLTTPDARDLGA
jgi:broad specificity phosphatase PhoE